jgi:group I intron endonuclease
MTDTWILYQTVNNVNGKIYVGVHKVANTKYSRNYLGSGLALKTAIEKYGKKNFTRTTLAEFTCGKSAYEAEAVMVTKEFIDRKDVYNMCLGGWGGGIHTPETNAKIIAASIGRKHTPEAKAKMSAAHKGKILTEQHIANIVAARKGKDYIIKSRTKLSDAPKRKVLSQEHRNKISAINKGKTIPIETRNKMSAASPRNKPVIINGKYYISSTQFSKCENIRVSTVTSRIRNSKPKWVEWRLATEEEIDNFSTRN